MKHREALIILMERVTKLFLVLLVVLFTSACGVSETKKADIAIETLEFQQMLADFKSNPVTAKEKYNGKIIEIKGKADSVISDVHGNQKIFIFSLQSLDSKLQKWTVRCFSDKQPFEGMNEDVYPSYPGDIVTVRGRLDLDNIKGYYLEKGGYIEKNAITFENNQWVYIKPQASVTISRDIPIVLTSEKIVQIAREQNENRFQALANYNGIVCKTTGQIMKIEDGRVILAINKIRVECKGISSDEIRNVKNGQFVTVQGNLSSTKGLLINKGYSSIILDKCSFDK